MILSTSPLDGLGITSAGRLSVGGKSPLTGGIKEANGGGVAATKMVRHGIKAIIVEGLPQKGEFFILHINKDGAQLKPAEHLMGLGTYAVAEKVYKEYGDGVGLVTIGQAGEYRLGAAGVFINDIDGDTSRACARGGMGAVMGAKGLKAVVIEDDGRYRPPVSDEKAFTEARRALHKAILDEETVRVYTDYGTMGMLMNLNAVSGMPTLNFRKGSWEKAEEISGERFRDLILGRGGEGKTTHRCMPTCVIQCSNVFPDEHGKKLVAPLEYESVTMLGPNLGISDLDKLALLTRMCNDYGLDTIEVGAALGVAAETDLLAFGDAARVEELIREIGRGTTLGKILGSGAKVTGQVFGVLRVPVVKGQSMAGHEPRGIKGMSVTYAMSPMGADHTAAPTYRGQIDHQKPEGQMELSRNIQVMMAYYDNLICLFVSRGVGKKPELLVNVINAIFGTTYGPDYLIEVGKEIIKLEHVFNIGADVGQDYIPE
ncbi:MAG: aldehyde ferredoxin oxidoreductase C-terminal domain-containing protein, partial [Pseudomonadota bacterium]